MKAESRWLSIVALGILYLCMWGWVFEHLKDCNRNDKWEVCLSRLFILLHIIAMIVFFIWGWM